QGVGISPSAIGRLFSPFVQADGSTTRRFGGTGLGLSICKRLIELMNGKIGVRTRENEGSLFWFSIPQVYELAARRVEPKGGRATVVVVGMDTNRFDIIRSYLEAESFEVEDATTIGELVYLLDDIRVNRVKAQCVLIEMYPDVVSQLELVVALRRDRVYKDLNIVCIYRPGHRPVLSRAISVGADAFLFSPVKKRELILAVKKEASRKRAKKLPPGVRAAAAPSYVTRGDYKPARVLVVEDNKLMRKLAVNQLEHFGIEVDVVTNGKEAVLAVGQKAYDLVLMDCQMPEMDGFEATLKIRKEESMKDVHVPIIAMTAFAMKGDREHCLASGMDDYLKKPVSIRDLETVIDKWLPNFMKQRTRVR
ncbi:MAG: response regulator, partial [Candidatus Obscuribacterales bacterium]|nr:response regulator [Candidatus Obscuribacterales bacterium]